MQYQKNARKSFSRKLQDIVIGRVQFTQTVCDGHSILWVRGPIPYPHGCKHNIDWVYYASLNWLISADQFKLACHEAYGAWKSDNLDNHQWGDLPSGGDPTSVEDLPSGGSVVSGEIWWQLGEVVLPHLNFPSVVKWSLQTTEPRGAPSARRAKCQRRWHIWSLSTRQSCSSPSTSYYAAKLALVNWKGGTTPHKNPDQLDLLRSFLPLPTMYIGFQSQREARDRTNCQHGVISIGPQALVSSDYY